jgi:hypothetical protein
VVEASKLRLRLFLVVPTPSELVAVAECLVVTAVDYLVVADYLVAAAVLAETLADVAHLQLQLALLARLQIAPCAKKSGFLLVRQSKFAKLSTVALRAASKFLTR